PMRCTATFTANSPRWSRAGAAAAFPRARSLHFCMLDLSQKRNGIAASRKPFAGRRGFERRSNQILEVNDMTIFDWLLTGRNNAFDWWMYAPPGSFRGFRLPRVAYRIGWLIGMWGYPFN